MALRLAFFPSDFELRTGHGVIALIVARQCDNFALTPLQAGRRTLPVNFLSMRSFNGVHRACRPRGHGMCPLQITSVAV
jgi:hypothetical protein